MSLLDAVVEQKIPCKIPGCRNTWTLEAEGVVKSWTQEDYHVPKRMCPSCKTQFDDLQPVEVKCSTRDCEEMLKIFPYQQLILNKKHKPLERETFFCESCQRFLKEVGDLEVPCRMHVCQGVWTWFASSRLRSGGKSLDSHPERRLCRNCYATLKTLTSRKLSCKIKGCDQEWSVDRMTQLEWKLAGKKDPKRMCPPCNTSTPS